MVDAAGLLIRWVARDNAAMSKPFQLTKRTALAAVGWLCLSIVAGVFGALALDRSTTAAVFGFVVAFNSFWAIIGNRQRIAILAARVRLSAGQYASTRRFLTWQDDGGPSGRLTGRI
jgi:hypothetical protein